MGLAIWSPFPLEVIAVAPGTLATEKWLHDTFADDRWHHEWFRASPRLLTVVSALKRGMPLNAAIDLVTAKASAA